MKANSRKNKILREWNMRDDSLNTILHLIAESYQNSFMQSGDRERHSWLICYETAVYRVAQNVSHYQQFH